MRAARSRSSASARARKALLETLLLEALRHTAEEAAQDGTAVLLVLEDVHDADPLSIELLGAVVRAIATLPVLMLVSQRPPDGSTVPDVAARVTPAAALPGGDATTPVQCIELQGLDAAQAEQLIRAQLAALFPERAAAVPPALVERIVERAQGNPFTIEELLKHLRDRGLDPHHPDTWQALEWPCLLYTSRQPDRRADRGQRQCCDAGTFRAELDPPWHAVRAVDAPEPDLGIPPRAEDRQSRRCVQPSVSDLDPCIPWYDRGLDQQLPGQPAPPRPGQQDLHRIHAVLPRTDHRQRDPLAHQLPVRGKGSVRGEPSPANRRRNGEPAFTSIGLKPRAAGTSLNPAAWVVRPAPRTRPC